MSMLTRAVETGGGGNHPSRLWLKLKYRGSPLITISLSIIHGIVGFEIVIDSTNFSIYRDSPVSAVSISAVPGILKFTKSTK